MGMRSGKSVRGAAKAAARKKSAAKKTKAKAKAKKPAKRAAAKRPAAKRPAAKRPAAKRPAAKRPAKPAAARTRAATDPNKVMREFAKRIVDVTVANDDTASFALYSDNVESVEMTTPPTYGVPALKEKFAMWRNMTSQSSFRPRSVLVDGKTIVIEWDGRVTLAGSNKIVELAEVAVHEIANGKIVRERFYYNPAVLQPEQPAADPPSSSSSYDSEDAGLEEISSDDEEPSGGGWGDDY